MSFVKRLVPGLVHGKWVELGFLASIPGNTTWYDVISIKGEQTEAKTTRQQESQSQPTPKQLKSRWIPFKDSGTYAFSIWKSKQVQSIRLCVASMQSDLQSCSFIIKLQVIIYMLFIDKHPAPVNRLFIALLTFFLHLSRCGAGFLPSTLIVVHEVP